MDKTFVFQENKPLRDLSTFSIGGEARLFVEVCSTEQMQEVLRYCRQNTLPFFILGKGSNCLFHDKGFDGMVIHNKISYYSINGLDVGVGAGYSFSLLGVQTARANLSGLEFASGIPASVGGAIFMNAGANRCETSSCLQEVLFVDEKGELLRIPKEQVTFSYRYSSFQSMRGAIVGAKFLLSSSPVARKQQLDILEYRMQTQPYKDPSAGCVFKNPEGHSAGALIERAGLKGLSIGGAMVSPKHANFIVNTGHASAQDVLDLARLVQERVLSATGIEIEMEIRCIPYQIL